MNLFKEDVKEFIIEVGKSFFNKFHVKIKKTDFA